jgi:hypothetical protein
VSDFKTCPTCGTEYPLSERFCPRDGTALRGSNPLGDLVGSVVHEKFHVMKKLGEGGMGAVYLAEHVKMGRKMALKVMNPGMHQDADAIARFNREAKNASQINHPNVCAIYDFGETPEGLIYLAMEFIEGSSLSGLIEKNGALGAPRAASIIHQAADALQVAHDYGIVHRDLKPDNIMIAKARDGSDLVKVVDFGIAKASSSDAQKVTKTGLVVGTPEYMSPEQLAGDKLDGRSDIYSLGLVAFNCLTGKLPFPSNSAQEAMIMRLTDEPKRLDEMRPDISWPEELQDVMTKALMRDAAERYQNAADFGRQLSKAVENMPHTMIAEAGTQVIGSGAAVAAAAAKTAAAPAVPKTRVASGAERGGAAAPAAAPELPAKKSAMPMIAAAAAVVIIGGFAAWKMDMFGGGAPPSTPADTGAQVAQNPTGTANPNPAANNGGATVPNANNNAGSKTPNPGPTNPAANPGRSGTPNTTPNPGPTAPTTTPYDAVMAKWGGMLNGTLTTTPSDAEARVAVDEMEKAKEGVTGARLGNLHVMQGVLQYQIDRTTEACRSLKRSLDLATGVALKLAEGMITEYKCPQ